MHKKLAKLKKKMSLFIIIMNSSIITIKKKATVIADFIKTVTSFKPQVGLVYITYQY